MEEEDPICPDGYPDCRDPEIMKLTDEEIGLDTSMNEQIIMDDYRLDKTQPDFTYFNPHSGAVWDPPTKRSVQMGRKILEDSYCDDDPKNAWLYELPKGPFISVVAKHEWGAAPVKHRQPLRFPVSNVRFHHTGADVDNMFPQCIEIVSNLQRKSIEQEGLPDIPYNFLIGGDGQLYEGRGWYVDSERSQNDPKLKYNCLEIAYIGNFKDKQPSWTMVEMAVDVIRYGLQTNHLAPALKVIPFQTPPS